MDTEGLSVTRISSSPHRRQDPLAWSTVPQAVWLISRGATFGTAFRISLAVGTLLTLVNQGAVLASGHVSVVTVSRVLANYLIPYVVSSVGYLAPFRVRQPIGVDDAGE